MQFEKGINVKQVSDDSPREPEGAQIIIGTDEKRLADEAIKVLAKQKEVYQRGGMLVRVLTEDGNPRIGRMAPATARELMAEGARWFSIRHTAEGAEKRPAHPPAWAVEAVMARGVYSEVRVLRGVVEVPVLRADGTVLQKPGYDPASSILFIPNDHFPPVPTNPTRAQIKDALARLLEVVVDFPFSNDAHRSAWLAGALTPFARHAFEGPAPLFLVDGNQRGAGKGKLTDAAALIFSKRGVARTPQPTDESEERKAILAIALEGEPIVLVDNITRPFGSGALDAALTATEWRDRLMRTNERPMLPLFSVWWATGNNVQFRSGVDTSRRTLHIRLDSPDDKPENRRDFRHADLLGHVRRNRGGLAAAALTLLRGYCAAGKPDQGLKSWGSFEGWSALVRATLVWAGLPEDPYSAHEGLLEAADQDVAVLAELHEAWADLCKKESEDGAITIGYALRCLEEDRELKRQGRAPRYARLGEVLSEITDARPGQMPTVKKVGYFFRHFKGRPVSGKSLIPHGKRTNQGQAWAVRSVTTR